MRSPYTNECVTKLYKESTLLKKSMEYMNLATFTKYTEAEAFMKLEDEKSDDKENQSKTESTVKENPQ